MRQNNCFVDQPDSRNGLDLEEGNQTGKALAVLAAPGRCVLASLVCAFGDVLTLAVGAETLPVSSRLCKGGPPAFPATVSLGLRRLLLASVTSRSFLQSSF